MCNIVSYKLISIPDMDSIFRQGRNIAAVLEKLMYMVMILPVSGCITLTWLYDPCIAASGNRVQIYISASGDENIKQLLHYTISRMRCRVEKCSLPDNYPWGELIHNCDIVKAFNIHPPSVTKEYNPDILPGYYDLIPFEANQTNDYSGIDEHLANSSDPLVYSVSVKRYDRTSLNQLLAKYCQRLAMVNSGRIDGTVSFINSKNNRLEKQKDLLADETKRNIAKILSAVRLESCTFSIRTMAKRLEKAELMAAIAADSGFANGSYKLFHDLVPQKNAISSIQSCCQVLPEVKVSYDLEELNEIYKDLKLLSNIACPDELTGVFRLPVASSSFRPKCMTCDTDPPQIPLEELLPFGQEVDEHV